MGGKIITGAIVIFVLALAASSATYVVAPGHRGIRVTLGKVAPIPKAEGFGLKAPFITTVFQQTIRQQAGKIDAQCYSSDLQQIKISLRVLYRQPEAKVVTLYR